MKTFREYINEETPGNVDILARELLKVKNKDSSIYKKIHKLMMKGDEKSAVEGLNMIKKFKVSLME